MKVYHSSDGRTRYMVAANNRKEAAKLLGTTDGDIAKYGGVYPESYEPAKAARDQPGKVFMQPTGSITNQWIPSPE